MLFGWLGAPELRLGSRLPEGQLWSRDSGPAAELKGVFTSSAAQMNCLLTPNKSVGEIQEVIGLEDYERGDL